MVRRENRVLIKNNQGIPNIGIPCLALIEIIN